MDVVAGAIGDGQGRWLLQKRPDGKRHAGLWEFPGGKVEPSESPRDALVRELNEELTIRVSKRGLKQVAQARATPGQGEPAIVITLYNVPEWEGLPRAEPGAELRWVTACEIAGLPVPPLDRELAAQLFAAEGQGAE
jgi:8-oxo-dGTP diphosphatase